MFLFFLFLFGPKPSLFSFCFLSLSVFQTKRPFGPKRPKPEIPIIIFCLSTKISKKWPQKRSFFTFCKTQVHKKPVLLQPSFRPTICVFFQLVFFETKFIDVEQKHNLKSRNKYKKKENKTENQKREKINEEKLCN